MPQVKTAHERLRAAHEVCWRWNDATPLVPHSVVRCREIVLEQAVLTPLMALRFVAGVDLIALGRVAQNGRTVPDLFDLYCRHVAPVHLTDFLRALSLLVAERALVSSAPASDDSLGL
jgi:hypothetical protein